MPSCAKRAFSFAAWKERSVPGHKGNGMTPYRDVIEQRRQSAEQERMHGLQDVPECLRAVADAVELVH